MSKSRETSPGRMVDDLSRRFLDASFELFPEYGSSQGLEQFDHELSPNGPATQKKYIALLEKTLAEAEAIPASACSGDAWLDRRLLLAQTRIGLLNSRDLERWRNNPQQHADGAISCVFDLILRDPENWTRYAPAIASRLAKIPKYLDAGAACVRKPVPLWVKLAVETCTGAVSFLTELQNAFPGAGEPATARIFENARGAFKRYAESIAAINPGGTDDFGVGRPTFEFLMRENLGLDLSVTEAEQIGLRWVEKLHREIELEAKRLGGKPDDLLEQGHSSWKPSSGALIEEYRAVTKHMRERFVEKDLMSFPKGDKLAVLPVPAFLRHQFPTAAYHSPGPFAKRQQGIFWVNDLSLIAPTPEARAREVAQHFGIELTCAHEAYPGHHLQFVLQNRHRSHLRRTAHHPIYYEGWTLWCEKMCVDHEIFQDKLARLMQLRDALWRACRIVIDCRLHTGRGGFKGACRFLQEQVGFTAARARNDVNWYSSSPTTPMSYLLGRFEVEGLYEACVLRGGWPVKRFNDWILSFGAIPWSWIRRTLVNG